MKTLSDRIKAALAQSGISQADLVRATGAKAASVSNWVGGRTKNLKGANLVNAARVLGVEEAWLANGVGPMKKVDEEDLVLPSSEHMAIRMVDARLPPALVMLCFQPAPISILCFAAIGSRVMEYVATKMR